MISRDRFVLMNNMYAVVTIASTTAKELHGAVPYSKCWVLGPFLWRLVLASEQFYCAPFEGM